MHAADITLRDTPRSGQFDCFAIGDLHADSRGFDEERCKAWVAHICAHAGHAVAFAVGDYMNGQTPGHKHFEPDATRADYVLNMDGYIKHSLDHVERLLAPLREAGIPTVFIEGNHDRMVGAVGYTAMLADRCKGHFLGGAGFVRVRTGNAARIDSGRGYSTVIYAHHGARGGATPGPKVNAMHALMGAFDADIYIAGHVHDADLRVVDRVCVTRAGEGIAIQTRPVVLYRAPSFIERAAVGFTTYADRKEYGIADRGLMWPRINPKERTAMRHEFVQRRQAD